MVITGFSNPDFKLSKDYGATWQSIPVQSGELLQAADISSNGTYIVTGTNTHVYTSSDSGNTWNIASALSASSDWGSANVSDDGTKLFVGGYGHYARSLDGGATWQQAISPTGSLAEGHAIASADGKAVLASYGYSDSSDTPQISYDYGQTWAPVNGVQTDAFSQLFVSGNGMDIVVDSGYYGKFASNDGGHTWGSQSDLNTGFYSMTSDGAVMLSRNFDAATGNQALQVSTDHAVSWTTLAWPTFADTADYSYFPYLSSDGSTMYIIGSANTSGIPSTLAVGRIIAAAPTATTVDFSGTQAPSGVSAAIAQSVLRLTDTSQCGNIATSSILAPNTVTAPNGQTVVGGYAFTLDCATVGGNASVAVTLGERYADLSKVHVYKESSVGALTEITGKISLTNNAASTVISYNLTDSAQYDDAARANGKIVDPLYVAVDTAALAAPTPALASTGNNMLVVAAAAVVAIAGAALLLKRRTAR